MTQSMRMSIKQFKLFLDSVVKHNLEVGRRGDKVDDYIATMAMSSPGMAKTSSHFQVADGNRVGCTTFISATAEPQDVNGIPDIVEIPEVGKVTDWIKPEIFRKPPGEMFLFDEATKAPESMLNALSMLINERRAGMHHIPPGSTICLAGNNIGDNAGDIPMPTHVSNRVCRIQVYMTFEHWLEWAAEGGIDPLLTGFVRQHGASSFSFDPDQQTNPTYRSMARVNNLLKLNLPKDILTTAVAGYIGESAASRFRTYISHYGELDSPEQIIADPENARIPSGNNAEGMYYAVASSLIGHVNKKNIGKVMTYLNRLPSKEIIVFAVKDIMLRYPELSRDPSLSKWKLDNQRLFSAII